MLFIILLTITVCALGVDAAVDGSFAIRITGEVVETP